MRPLRAGPGRAVWRRWASGAAQGAPRAPQRPSRRVGRTLLLALAGTGAVTGAGLYALQTSSFVRDRVQEMLPGSIRRLDTLLEQTRAAEAGVRHALDSVQGVASVATDKYRAAEHSVTETAGRLRSAVGLGSDEKIEDDRPKPSAVGESDPKEEQISELALSAERQDETEALRRQIAELRTQLDLELQSRATELEGQAREEAEKELISERVRNAVDEAKQQAERDLARRMDTMVAQRRQEMDKELHERRAELEKEVLRELEKERKQRLDVLEDLKTQVNAVQLMQDDALKRETTRETARRIAVASFSFIDSANSGTSFAEEARLLADMLKEMGGEAELTQQVLESIPAYYAEHGVATVTELQARFQRVSRLANRASIVPEGGGFWAHLLATVVTALKVKESGPYVEGESVPARLGRAEFRLSKGDLAAAVVEVEAIESSLGQDLCQAWLQAARGRILIDQASRILTSEALLLQEAVAEAADGW